MALPRRFVLHDFSRLSLLVLFVLLPFFLASVPSARAEEWMVEAACSWNETDGSSTVEVLLVTDRAVSSELGGRAEVVALGRWVHNDGAASTTLSFQRIAATPPRRHPSLTFLRATATVSSQSPTARLVLTRPSPRGPPGTPLLELTPDCVSDLWSVEWKTLPRWSVGSSPATREVVMAGRSREDGVAVRPRCADACLAGASARDPPSDLSCSWMALDHWTETSGALPEPWGPVLVALSAPSSATQLEVVVQLCARHACPRILAFHTSPREVVIDSTEFTTGGVVPAWDLSLAATERGCVVLVGDSDSPIVWAPSREPATTCPAVGVMDLEWQDAVPHVGEVGVAGELTIHGSRTSLATTSPWTPQAVPASLAWGWEFEFALEEPPAHLDVAASSFGLDVIVSPEGGWLGPLALAGPDLDLSLRVWTGASLSLRWSRGALLRVDACLASSRSATEHTHYADQDVPCARLPLPRPVPASPHQGSEAGPSAFPTFRWLVNASSVVAQVRNATGVVSHTAIDASAWSARVLPRLPASSAVLAVHRVGPQPPTALAHWSLRVPNPAALHAELFLRSGLDERIAAPRVAAHSTLASFRAGEPIEFLAQLRRTRSAAHVLTVPESLVLRLRHETNASEPVLLRPSLPCQPRTTAACFRRLALPRAGLWTASLWLDQPASASAPSNASASTPAFTAVRVGHPMPILVEPAFPVAVRWNASAPTREASELLDAWGNPRLARDLPVFASDLRLNDPSLNQSNVTAATTAAAWLGPRTLHVVGAVPFKRPPTAWFAFPNGTRVGLRMALSVDVLRPTGSDQNAACAVTVRSPPALVGACTLTFAGRSVAGQGLAGRSLVRDHWNLECTRPGSLELDAACIPSADHSHNDTEDSEGSEDDSEDVTLHRPRHATVTIQRAWTDIEWGWRPTPDAPWRLETTLEDVLDDLQRPTMTMTTTTTTDATNPSSTISTPSMCLPALVSVQLRASPPRAVNVSLGCMRPTESLRVWNPTRMPLLSEFEEAFDAVAIVLTLPPSSTSMEEEVVRIPGTISTRRARRSIALAASSLVLRVTDAATAVRRALSPANPIHTSPVDVLSNDTLRIDLDLRNAAGLDATCEEVDVTTGCALPRSVALTFVPDENQGVGVRVGTPASLSSGPLSFEVRLTRAAEYDVQVWDLVPPGRGPPALLATVPALVRVHAGTPSSRTSDVAHSMNATHVTLLVTPRDAWRNPVRARHENTSSVVAVRAAPGFESSVTAAVVEVEAEADSVVEAEAEGASSTWVSVLERHPTTPFSVEILGLRANATDAEDRVWLADWRVEPSSAPSRLWILDVVQQDSAPAYATTSVLSQLPADGEVFIVHLALVTAGGTPALGQWAPEAQNASLQLTLHLLGENETIVHVEPLLVLADVHHVPGERRVLARLSEITAACGHRALLVAEYPDANLTSVARSVRVGSPAPVVLSLSVSSTLLFSPSSVVDNSASSTSHPTAVWPPLRGFTHPVRLLVQACDPREVHTRVTLTLSAGSDASRSRSTNRSTVGDDTVDEDYFGVVGRTLRANESDPAFVAVTSVDPAASLWEVAWLVDFPEQDSSVVLLRASPSRADALTHAAVAIVRDAQPSAEHFVPAAWWSAQVVRASLFHNASSPLFELWTGRPTLFERPNAGSVVGWMTVEWIEHWTDEPAQSTSATVDLVIATKASANASSRWVPIEASSSTPTSLDLYRNLNLTRAGIVRVTWGSTRNASTTAALLVTITPDTPRSLSLRPALDAATTRHAVVEWVVEVRDAWQNLLLLEDLLLANATLEVSTSCRVREQTRAARVLGNHSEPGVTAQLLCSRPASLASNESVEISLVRERVPWLTAQSPWPPLAPGPASSATAFDFDFDSSVLLRDARGADAEPDAVLLCSIPASFAAFQNETRLRRSPRAPACLHPSSSSRFPSPALLTGLETVAVVFASDVLRSTTVHRALTVGTNESAEWMATNETFRTHSVLSIRSDSGPRLILDESLDAFPLHFLVSVEVDGEPTLCPASLDLEVRTSALEAPSGSSVWQPLAVPVDAEVDAHSATHCRVSVHRRWLTRDPACLDSCGLWLRARVGGSHASPFAALASPVSLQPSRSLDATQSLRVLGDTLALEARNAWNQPLGSDVPTPGVAPAGWGAWGLAFTCGLALEGSSRWAVPWMTQNPESLNHTAALALARGFPPVPGCALGVSFVDVVGAALASGDGTARVLSPPVPFPLESLVAVLPPSSKSVTRVVLVDDGNAAELVVEARDREGNLLDPESEAVERFVNETRAHHWVAPRGVYDELPLQRLTSTVGFGFRVVADSFTHHEITLVHPTVGILPHARVAASLNARVTVQLPIAPLSATALAPGRLFLVTDGLVASVGLGLSPTLFLTAWDEWGVPRIAPSAGWRLCVAILASGVVVADLSASLDARPFPGVPEGIEGVTVPFSSLAGLSTTELLQLHARFLATDASACPAASSAAFTALPHIAGSPVEFWPGAVADLTSVVSLASVATTADRMVSVPVSLRGSSGNPLTTTLPAVPARALVEARIVSAAGLALAPCNSSYAFTNSSQLQADVTVCYCAFDQLMVRVAGIAATAPNATSVQCSTARTNATLSFVRGVASNPAANVESSLRTSNVFFDESRLVVTAGRVYRWEFVGVDSFLTQGTFSLSLVTPLRASFAVVTPRPAVPAEFAARATFDPPPAPCSMESKRFYIERSVIEIDFVCYTAGEVEVTVTVDANRVPEPSDPVIGGAPFRLRVLPASLAPDRSLLRPPAHIERGECAEATLLARDAYDNLLLRDIHDVLLEDVQQALRATWDPAGTPALWRPRQSAPSSPPADVFSFDPTTGLARFPVCLFTSPSSLATAHSLHVFLDEPSLPPTDDALFLPSEAFVFEDSSLAPSRPTTQVHPASFPSASRSEVVFFAVNASASAVLVVLRDRFGFLLERHAVQSALPDVRVALLDLRSGHESLVDLDDSHVVWANETTEAAATHSLEASVVRAVLPSFRGGEFRLAVAVHRRPVATFRPVGSDTWRIAPTPIVDAFRSEVAVRGPPVVSAGSQLVFLAFLRNADGFLLGPQAIDVIGANLSTLSHGHSVCGVLEHEASGELTIGCDVQVAGVWNAFVDLDVGGDAVSLPVTFFVEATRSAPPRLVVPDANDTVLTRCGAGAVVDVVVALQDAFGNAVPVMAADAAAVEARVESLHACAVDGGANVLQCQASAHGPSVTGWDSVLEVEVVLRGNVTCILEPPAEATVRVAGERSLGGSATLDLTDVRDEGGREASFSFQGIPWFPLVWVLEPGRDSRVRPASDGWTLVLLDDTPALTVTATRPARWKEEEEEEEEETLRGIAEAEVVLQLETCGGFGSVDVVPSSSVLVAGQILPRATLVVGADPMHWACDWTATISGAPVCLEWTNGAGTVPTCAVSWSVSAREEGSNALVLTNVTLPPSSIGDPYTLELSMGARRVPAPGLWDVLPGPPVSVNASDVRRLQPDAVLADDGFFFLVPVRDANAEHAVSTQGMCGAHLVRMQSHVWALVDGFAPSVCGAPLAIPRVDRNQTSRLIVDDASLWQPIAAWVSPQDLRVTAGSSVELRFRGHTAAESTFLAAEHASLSVHLCRGILTERGLCAASLASSASFTTHPSSPATVLVRVVEAGTISVVLTHANRTILSLAPITIHVEPENAALLLRNPTWGHAFGVVGETVVLVADAVDAWGNRGTQLGGPIAQALEWTAFAEPARRVPVPLSWDLVDDGVAASSLTFPSEPGDWILRLAGARDDNNDGVDEDNEVRVTVISAATDWTRSFWTVGSDRAGERLELSTGDVRVLTPVLRSTAGMPIGSGGFAVDGQLTVTRLDAAPMNEGVAQDSDCESCGRDLVVSFTIAEAVNASVSVLRVEARAAGRFRVVVRDRRSGIECLDLEVRVAPGPVAWWNSVVDWGTAVREAALVDALEYALVRPVDAWGNRAAPTASVVALVDPWWKELGGGLERWSADACETDSSGRFQCGVRWASRRAGPFSVRLVDAASGRLIGGRDGSAELHFASLAALTLPAPLHIVQGSTPITLRVGLADAHGLSMDLDPAAWIVTVAPLECALLETSIPWSQRSRRGECTPEREADTTVVPVVRESGSGSWRVGPFALRSRGEWVVEAMHATGSPSVGLVLHREETDALPSTTAHVQCDREAAAVAGEACFVVAASAEERANVSALAPITWEAWVGSWSAPETLGPVREPWMATHEVLVTAGAVDTRRSSLIVTEEGVVRLHSRLAEMDNIPGAPFAVSEGSRVVLQFDLRDARGLPVSQPTALSELASPVPTHLLSDGSFVLDTRVRLGLHCARPASGWAPVCWTVTSATASLPTPPWRCPVGRLHTCWHGHCAATADDCHSDPRWWNLTRSEHGLCPPTAPFSGSKTTLDVAPLQCTGVSPAQSEPPARCVDGSDALVCPDASCAPGLVRCGAGFCAPSATHCQLLPPPLPLRAISWDLPPVRREHPCGPGSVECWDGRCGASLSECASPITCPDPTAVLCADRTCVRDERACGVEWTPAPVTLCPSTHPVRCAGLRTNVCVAATRLCPSQPRACPPGRPLACLVRGTGAQCVASSEECDAANGTRPACEDDEVSSGGVCLRGPPVAAVAAVARERCVADATRPFLCARGTCVGDLTECIEDEEDDAAAPCPVTNPLRCPDGTCRARVDAECESREPAPCPTECVWEDGSVDCVAHALECLGAFGHRTRALRGRAASTQPPWVRWTRRESDLVSEIVGLDPDSERPHVRLMNSTGGPLLTQWNGSVLALRGAPSASSLRSALASELTVVFLADAVPFNLSSACVAEVDADGPAPRCLHAPLRDDLELESRIDDTGLVVRASTITGDGVQLVVGARWASSPATRTSSIPSSIVLEPDLFLRRELAPLDGGFVLLVRLRVLPGAVRRIALVSSDQARPVSSTVSTTPVPVDGEEWSNPWESPGAIAGFSVAGLLVLLLLLLLVFLAVRRRRSGEDLWPPTWLWSTIQRTFQRPRELRRQSSLDLAAKRLATRRTSILRFTPALVPPPPLPNAAVTTLLRPQSPTTPANTLPSPSSPTSPRRGRGGFHPAALGFANRMPLRGARGPPLPPPVHRRIPSLPNALDVSESSGTSPAANSPAHHSPLSVELRSPEMLARGLPPVPSARRLQPKPRFVGRGAPAPPALASELAPVSPSDAETGVSTVPSTPRHRTPELASPRGTVGRRGRSSLASKAARGSAVPGLATQESGRRGRVPPSLARRTVDAEGEAPKGATDAFTTATAALARISAPRSTRRLREAKPEIRTSREG